MTSLKNRSRACRVFSILVGLFIAFFFAIPIVVLVARHTAHNKVPAVPTHSGAATGSSLLSGQVATATALLPAQVLSNTTVGKAPWQEIKDEVEDEDENKPSLKAIAPNSFLAIRLQPTARPSSAPALSTRSVQTILDHVSEEKAEEKKLNPRSQAEPSTANKNNATEEKLIEKRLTGPGRRFCMKNFMIPYWCLDEDPNISGVRFKDDPMGEKGIWKREKMATAAANGGPAGFDGIGWKEGL